MQKRASNYYITFIVTIILISLSLVDCKKKDESVKFPLGIFPDTVLNLEGLNSEYDDYNSTILEITGSLPVIFSSNRKSSGGQFDLEQGAIGFTFNKNDGTFVLSSMMTQDVFLNNLITKAVTTRNDFGPYRTFSSNDGLEYFILSSENAEGNLDLNYCKNVPQYGTNIPDVDGPYPIKLLNTSFDDAYLSFDLNLDSAYFTSNVDGNFDIYVKTRPEGMDISTWFDSDYTPSSKVDSINGPDDDKCPMVYNKFMVITSNRPGGYGGYDLYYSIFKNGNWSSPVNLGPGINTEYNEYRPLLGSYADFKNIYMIFSSDRPGGKGGFDLYFTGLTIPGK